MPCLRAELKTLVLAATNLAKTLDPPFIYAQQAAPKPLAVKKPAPRPKPEPVPEPKIELQPIKKQDAIPNDAKSLIASLGVPVLDHPPSDSRAKRIKNSWKQRQVAIAILVDKMDGPIKNLLLNIARAIDTLIAPCKVIATTRHEQENTWDIFLSAQELKHIIAPDTILTGNLLKHLHEVPGQNKRLLGDKPLLLLPDLTLYLKDPLLKASLWKTLCVLLPKSS